MHKLRRQPTDFTPHRLHSEPMTEIRQRFAAQVRAARKRKNLTQEQLSALANCSNDSVSNIERAVSSASLELIAALIEVLDLDSAQLFAGRRKRRKMSDKRAVGEAELVMNIEELDDQNLALLAKIAKAMIEK